MKFLLVALAVVAAASAQTYNPFNQFNQYNPYNPYNPFQRNQYNPFQRNQYTTPSPYRPFVSSTPSPYRPFVSSTAAPVAIAPPTPTPLPVSIAKVASYDSRYANTVKYGNEINPDGSYSYFYETDNGIAAQEQGVPRNFGGNPPVAPVVAQGSFSWTSPEGLPVAISYIADENGYQPQGAAIPTAPPIPEAIARSLEYIARTAPRK